MRLTMRCPWCGHDTMHYGEPAAVRDETRDDVFSCRGCGSAYGPDEIEEIAEEYRRALAAVGATAARLEELRGLPFENRDGAGI